MPKTLFNAIILNYSSRIMFHAEVTTEGNNEENTVATLVWA